VSASRLSPIQIRVLRAIADLVPRWTLSGGGALAALHTRHRVTRDLDLFLQAHRRFGREPEDAKARLEAAGFDVFVQQRVEAFCRLSVRDGTETTTVDLIADPVPLAEPPVETDVDGARILVDTPHQIFVNKLCALLGRSELRDLEDVRALLENGRDLRRGIEDAHAQDRGFSPLSFAWVLRELPVRALGAALGRTHEELETLETFRAALLEHVLAMVLPEE
jgi:hypothetical protein